MENLKHDIKTVLITREQIAKRVHEMGQQITKDYAGKEIVLVGILKGAMPFLCDLMREIDLPVILDTMVVSSYGDATTSSGLVKIKKDLDSDIRGRHVIVVEDIIDTGITMAALTPILEKRGAASVELAIFLDKRERREKEVNVKYIGYEIPDKFIVGYGCDYAQKYRNLPEICELDNKVFAQAK
ncbi:hypoxanthine phosphoribosyltransferase [Dialister sp.]|uniref:hypoxanthine phosphoribosyltransferase n=1 Tax=Dialister sp. TaxID=1955814 RepID=UPI003390214D